MYSQEDDKIKDECGVFGIYSNDEIQAASIAYYALYALQHRGQESAGIVVSHGEELDCHKDMGLVSDVFQGNILDDMKGSCAIGHVRYSTTGASNITNAQPMMGQCKLGQIALAHNGNIVNADVIRELLEDAGVVFHTGNDTEVILNLISRAAKKGIEKAVSDTIQAIKGSFALVILTKDKLIGVRDQNGIRPLCLGSYNGQYMLSSESCAFDAVGGEFIRDIKPGEIVIIDKDGLKSINFGEKTNCQTCAFEYIYFARPDSTIDKIDVYLSRVRAGEQLFKECPVKADMVVGVPDSGIPAAVGYAKASGIPYDMGLIKNRYVGRTFITPSQELRERAVAVKLNPLRVNVNGKRVILIDDSIVRGTTSKKLVELFRRAGAKEVHLLVASPVVKFPCYFGIDTGHRSELIGARMALDEIRDSIGCDSIGYLSVEGLKNAVDPDKGLCLGCFNGVYPVPAPVESEKVRLEK
jgi:amidophosphoribosyltransferase